MNRPLTTRQRNELEGRQRTYRITKMDRDHELELLLGAGVPLAEARAIVDGEVMA